MPTGDSGAGVPFTVGINFQLSSANGPVSPTPAARAGTPDNVSDANTRAREPGTMVIARREMENIAVLSGEQQGVRENDEDEETVIRRKKSEGGKRVLSNKSHTMAPWKKSDTAKGPLAKPVDVQPVMFTMKSLPGWYAAVPVLMTR